MGTTVNVQGVIEKIRFHQARTAVRTQTADLAMTHLASRQACHHPVLKTKRGIDVINRPLSTTTSSSR